MNARTARASLVGLVFHVINRGNARQKFFRQEEMWEAIVGLRGEAQDRVPVRLTGYCSMTNHFHPLVWSHSDGDLSRWMQSLLTSHVRRYHQPYGSSGHVGLGRFRAFPAQE